MPDDIDRAQKAAEKRLAACADSLWVVESEQEAEMREELSHAAGPFCGCDTCIVREVLDAAWPFLLNAAREEVKA